MFLIYTKIIMKRKRLFLVSFHEDQNILILKKIDKEENMKAMGILTAVLIVIGGLNWGLVGFLNFDLVATVFGNMSTLARLVYVLVGLSAIYQAINLRSLATSRA